MGLKVGTLREIGAKKGDVVAFHDDSEYKFTIGWINESSAYGTAQHCGREFSDNWSLTATQTWRILSPEEPTGPVRTVTRKEIVPGVYGGLEVGQAVNGKVFLAVPIANFGREQIETLIDNLGAVRDALEDGE